MPSNFCTDTGELCKSRPRHIMPAPIAAFDSRASLHLAGLVELLFRGGLSKFVGLVSQLDGESAGLKT